MTSEATQAVKATKKPINWKLSISTWGACACVVLGIAVAIPPLVVLCNTTGDKFTLNNLSSLGSYWQGAVASLFSLGAFLLIYATFLAQQKQIAQQDKQLEDQKRQFEAELNLHETELREQQKQFQSQQESIARQTFETMFFQLLTLHHQIVSQIQIAVCHNIYRGRDSFEKFYNRMRYEFMEPHIANLATVSRGDIAMLYLKFYKCYQGDLSHYFRTLYHIFKFVNDSNIKDKKRYTSLARAQLSQYELALLCYNGITPVPPETTNKFEELIVAFKLLDNLDDSLLCNGHSYKTLYLDPREAARKTTP
jgi:hypothetical protein